MMTPKHALLIAARRQTSDVRWVLLWPCWRVVIFQKFD
jgi:hypothetical protein